MMSIGRRVHCRFICVVMGLGCTCILYFGFTGTFHVPSGKRTAHTYSHSADQNARSAFYRQNADETIGGDFDEQRSDDKTVAYDCETEMDKLNKEGATVQQDDPRLIKVIKQCYLEDPAPASSPYNLTEPNRFDYSQGKQSPYIDNMLLHAENGYYVECGSGDGERFSNTLLFEKYRKWTGLLIDPNIIEFRKLRTKHRKSHSINACLNKDPYPQQFMFKLQRGLSRVIKGEVPLNRSTSKKDISVVQCFPFYSILLAVGRTKIDFFSLDIEGNELAVLKTIPWDKVDIKVLIVEYNYIEERKKGLVDFLSTHNYTSMPKLRSAGWQDIVFVKRGVKYDKNVKS